MNHRKFGKKLGRNHNQRKALFRSQIRAFFTYGSIKTTETKAKAVSPIIERLCHLIVTKPELTAARELYRHLQNRTQVGQVMKILKELHSDQSSNFTKIVRIKHRIGDDALIVKLTFIKPISFVPSPSEEVKPKEVKKTQVKSVKKVSKITKTKEKK